MADHPSRKAQKSPFGPACPRCGSKEAVIDPTEASNRWREYVVYAGMLLGAMTVTLHMRCEQCGMPFKAWKSQTKPPSGSGNDAS